MGSWKMESSEGFDKIMERLGVNFITRKAGNLMRPTLVVQDLGNGCYCMRSESTVKTTECTFRVGEKFKETTPDGRVVTSLITLENGVMKQDQVDDKKTTHIERVIDGDKLTTVSDDVHIFLKAAFIFLSDR